MTKMGNERKEEGRNEKRKENNFRVNVPGIG